MTTFLRIQGRKAFLAGVALSVLLTPTFVQPAEREGTVLFFSLEDLQQMLFHPSLPSLRPLLSGFAWREWPEAAEQDGPLERNIRWGNGRDRRLYSPWNPSSLGLLKIITSQKGELSWNCLMPCLRSAC